MTTVKNGDANQKCPTCGGNVDRMEAIDKLTNDLHEAAATMGKHEIRFLVDSYYVIQHDRTSTANQLKAAKEAGEPARILDWITSQASKLERNIKITLDKWTANRTAGIWCRSITGVGEVITAGLLSHIDITKAPTAGKIYSFAGLNPDANWLSRADANAMVKDILSVTHTKTVTMDHIAEAAQRVHRSFAAVEKASRNKEGKFTPASFAAGLAKRPYNAKLKTLCWKLGDSFVKFHSLCTCSHWSKAHENEDGACAPKKKDGTPIECECKSFTRKSTYGDLWHKRKKQEVSNNQAGKFSETATATLEKKKIQDKATRERYESGMLPDGRVDLRARRIAVKIFLSHLHEVLYFLEYGKLTRAPYVFSKDPSGHSHYIPVPNQHLIPGFAEAKAQQAKGK